MKTFYTVIFLYISSAVFAQTSPVKFLNQTCTINVDTSGGSKIAYKDLIELRYKFVNTGAHLTFIDSVRFPSCITKPKDTSILALNFSNFFVEKGAGLGGLIRKDTCSSINIPFYYEGKTYYEKIICNYTFGKSRLIEYDNPVKPVNDSVAKFFIENKKDTITRKYPSIRFTVYYSVKNTTNKPVWCTKELIGWYDTDIRDEAYRTNEPFNTRYVIIPPHTTYKIPIKMNMHNKYRFSKGGHFLVFSEDVFEVHQFKIKSDFEPKGKYIY